MRDQDKTKVQLIAEVEELRRRVAEFDGVEARRRPSEEAPRESDERFQKVLEDGPIGNIGMIEDITERKRAEEALKKAHDELEEKVKERTAALSKANEELAVFKRFAEAAGQGFSMAHLDGHITYLNPALCRMLGEEASQEVVGKHLSAYFSEDSLRIGEQKIRPALEQRGYWEGELPMLSRQGTALPTWHHTFMIRDERGSPLRMAVVITDITERKRAEEALRQSEEKHRGLVEAFPDSVVMSDLTGHVLFASRQTWTLLGLADADEMTGQSVFDCVIESDRGRLAANLAQLLQAGVRRNTEYTALRKDGSTAPTETSSAVIRDAAGKPKAVMAVIRDITQRKKAEEALRQSHNELRAIYEQIVEGIIVADAATGSPVRANAAYCRMLGYCEDEAYSLTPQRLHPPEVLPKVWEHLEAAKQGIVARIEEVPFLRKDGSTLYADVVSSKICYNGRPGWISFFHDVSERRRARIALERERRSLEHMLRASDHERQLIAYDIHDGLAQQLAGALMQFQVYEHLKGTKPDEAQKAYDGGVMLLRQGHVEARRLISGVRPPILDESGVVAAIAHLVHDPAFDQGPKVEFHSRVTFNRLDPVVENVIYRIVQEGLSNARNHSKSKTIRVSVMQRGDRLRIAIRDWGVGFDPKRSQENRFGLEGIRERARLLEGKCRIKSQPGAGTSIIVELPVAEREAER